MSSLFLKIKSVLKHTFLYPLYRRDKIKRMIRSAGVCIRVPTGSALNEEKRDVRVTVSLTSFPARIGYVDKPIRSVMNQTCKPDRIVLWLEREKFPNGEEDLPKALRKLCAHGLTIGWVDEAIGPYTKLIPALEAYPEDIIVTIDDDMYYPTEWLAQLLHSFETVPRAVHCHITTGVSLKDGVYTFTDRYGTRGDGSLSYRHKVLGVSGVLYPPHCLHEDVTKRDLFMTLAPTNDDVWFWAMAIRKQTPICWIRDGMKNLIYVEGEQRNTPCLYKINNCGENLRTVQTKAVFERYELTRFLEEDAPQM